MQPLVALRGLAGEAARLKRAIAAVVHRIDPAIAVANTRRMEEVVASSVARDRFLTRLLSTLGALAVVLAVVGIFGVVSYGVTQRRKEIGVRMAVGATRGRVLGSVVANALRLTAAGVVLGAVAAMLLTRALQGMLFGVSRNDPATFAGAALALLCCAAAASALPALRAAGTQPRAVLYPD